MSTSTATAKPVRISRDEMNLAEFPLTVLSTRVNPKVKTLEFKDTIFDRNGKPMERKWIITAADKFGLPTASDDEVLLGLLKLTVDSGLNDRKVYFTRYELLKALRWSTEGRSYLRLSQALDRLSGVRIKTTNGFFDNQSKNYSTKNFGLVDGYEINDGRDSKLKPSFFIWSEVLFKSFQVGFIKKLDLDFYLGLTSSVSKRLYRYLDKHFWYKSRVKMNLFVLAHEKIGVSRNYRYPSSIRQQLDPALEELKERGFISGHEYTGKGKHTEISFFAARGKVEPLDNKNGKGRSATGKVSLNVAGDDRVHFGAVEQDRTDVSSKEKITEQLIERGIVAQQAVYLLEHKSAEELPRIARIVKYFDSLVSSSSHLVSRNPAGFLYRAVQRADSFVLPDENGQTRLELSTRGKRAAVKSEYKGAGEASEGDYLVERKREIRKLMGDIEAEMLERMTQEVRGALGNVKGLISESGFERAVEHAVEEKVAKLFALPDFDEWKKRKDRT